MTVQNLQEFLNALNELGIKYEGNGDGRTITIKGELDSVNTINNQLYISIRQKEYVIEYAEIDNRYLLAVMLPNSEMNVEYSICSIEFQTKPHVYYKSGRLYINY